MSLQFTENDAPGFQAKAEYESQAASRKCARSHCHRAHVVEKDGFALCAAHAALALLELAVSNDAMHIIPVTPSAIMSVVLKACCCACHGVEPSSPMWCACMREAKLRESAPTMKTPGRSEVAKSAQGIWQ